MAKEQTTLEKMKNAEGAAAEARLEKSREEAAVEALSKGSHANIDGMRVILLSGGRVCLGSQGGDREFVLSERQFLGLMGWGHKHVGDGPNGKKGGAAG